MAIKTLIFLLHICMYRSYSHTDFNTMSRKRESEKLFDKEKNYDKN